jgi:very-short-patch-repair endonuclease
MPHNENPEAENVGQKRLTQVFKFLKELNELRNPVPRDMSTYATVLRIDTWPVHPFVEVRRGDRAEEDDNADGEEKLEPIIRIRRARLTSCPTPPEVLDDWLKPGWQMVEAEVEVVASRNFPDGEHGSITVEFTEAEERVTALNAWKAARTNWVIAERPAVAARQLFERIHALWTTMQREGDRIELVVADGMLGMSDQLIHHPVLLQRVSLEFDPSGPEFCFNTGTEKVELHRALLRLVPSIDGRMIGSFDQELEAEPVEPLGGVSTSGFLRRLVQGLFTDGEFLERQERGQVLRRPSMWREPVIFLRPRSAGLNTTLDYIVEDLDKGTEPPVGLARIVGVETSETAQPPVGGDDNEAPMALSVSSPDILFSKPANAEQNEIAIRLAQSKAVLVQGPPGTGKTHTIANLLGHLLAQGKTVLVTAHTTKALRVLRGHVDEALQPLCLSVLEGDADSQAQLSHAAQEIANRLSSSDATSLHREASLLRDQRRNLLNVAEALKRQLREARFSEIEEIVLGGEGIRPIEAAKRVKADAERDSWIPGPLQPGILCPLTDREVHQLYASQGTLTPSDEAQLAMPQPVLAALVPPADFRLLAIEQAGADAHAQTHRPELWADNAGAGYTAAHLQQLHQQVQAAAVVLSEEQNWLREVLFAGWMGGGLRQAWEDLLAEVTALSAEADMAYRLIMAHGPELPVGRPVAEVAATLGEIVAYIEGGGTLGLKTKLTRRGWHQLLEACRVEGRVPQTLDEFRALRAVAQLEEHRNRFASRWRRAVESLGGPSVETLGRLPERTAQGYAAEIRTRLDWRANIWEPLIEQLRAVGFRWEMWLAAHPPVPGDHGELARVQRAGSQGLVQTVEAQAALMRQAELSAALQQQRTYLAGFPQSEISDVLLQAQDGWDMKTYDAACRELARLEGLRDAYNTRLALLKRLESAAPVWAHAISHRDTPHDAPQPPGDASAAWRWRQWYQELERRASVSMTELQERLDKTTDEVRHLAAQIVELETWAKQCERTRLEERQALMGFVQTIRRVGRGTGRRAPELLRQARQLLASARHAVPVWIMPLSRVYESFDPREPKFDVVIIDEASQSDVTALAALYLGREHIIVGDKEQVTPDAVGQRMQEVDQLIATELPGIPNSHLYDGQTSIYDLSETSFGGVVALREHFRCVPEIIQFSNDLSYNLTICPLREPLSAAVRPALIAHRVHGFRRERSRTNEVEAEEIASLVIACLEDPAYAHNEFGKPTTFGVISLLGDEQALLIEQMLRRRLSPNIFAERRLLCGNAAQFQGDERDVVFLSMVDGPPDDGPLRFLGAGARDLFKKRYNVAVSRARNQLWVVHSLDPETHLQPGDLRRRLITHARDPQALLRLIEDQGRHTESVFEQRVLERLLTAGYRVRTQWPVGAYRIDLVVEGQKRRLAVECDGERWHTREQLQRDLERQAILERLGWIFVRIRGSVFFRSPDTAMAPVFAKLQALGIEPLGAEPLSDTDPSEPLVERVRRRAEALRAEWRDEKVMVDQTDAENAQDRNSLPMPLAGE